MADKKDIVIIGAGCTGLTAAIYARRAGKSVLVLENEGIGGQISHSPRVENFPGFAGISGMEFSDKLYEQATALGAEVDFVTVTGVRAGADMAVLTEDGEVPCKSVILAAGSRPRPLGVPREQELTGKGVSYCAICDGAFYKDKDVAVVGGGSAALQSVELLAGCCRSVLLIHRRQEFRGEAALAQRVCAQPNVRTALGCTVSALQGDSALTGITVRHADGSETSEAVAALFIAVGQQPQNAPFADVTSLDETGYILASEDCLTGTPGVFAAGDCRAKAVRQLTTAAADGTVAALAACAYINEQA